MKIELEKEETIDGKIFYHIKIDEKYEKAFLEGEEKFAEKYYEECIIRAKTNYPKTTTLKSFEL